MDRKEFLKASLRVGAAFGVGCPCALADVEEPKATPGAVAAPTPCGRIAGDYPHASTFESRAEWAKTWIGRFMRLMDDRLDEKIRRELMEANGRVCAQSHYGPPDPGQRVSIEDFVARLKEHVGPENARIEADVVYFNYVRNPNGLSVSDGYCLCPLVEDRPQDLSPTFCHCSCGYVGYMFERFTGRSSRVELLESVRRGGKSCRFAVYI
jgi:hypothetical protein